MEQVLSHMGHLARLRGDGAERRGPCPLHSAEKPDHRSFTANLEKHVFQCFHPECARGNVLDLWQAHRGLEIYEAALDLAEIFQLQTTPEQRRGARNVKRKPR